MSKVADAEGAAFWDKKWAGKKVVLRKEFVGAYLAAFKGSNAKVVDALAANVIGKPDEPHVTRQSFEHFLAKFGPFSKSYTKAASSLFNRNGVFHKWFHGHTSRKDAEKGMGKPGRYIVRFSEKYPSKMTLAYSKTKDGKLCLKNVLIHNVGEAGFSLQPKDKGGKAFASVVDLLAAQADLKEPVVSALHKKMVEEEESKSAGGDSYAAFDAADAGGGYAAFDDGSGGGSSGYDQLGGGDQGGGSGYAAFDAGAGSSGYDKLNVGGDADGLENV